jgi:hypothetical protein
MSDAKVTKRDVLAAVRLVAENGAVDFGAVSADDVIAYVDTTIAQLDAKAAKAKERATKNKAEGDELRAIVESVLTDELQTIDAITTAVQAIEGYNDITKSKVTARLTQIVKAGLGHKGQVKDGGRKVMAYAIGAPAETDEDAE